GHAAEFRGGFRCERGDHGVTVGSGQAVNRPAQAPARQPWVERPQRNPQEETGDGGQRAQAGEQQGPARSLGDDAAAPQSDQPAEVEGDGDQEDEGGPGSQNAPRAAGCAGDHAHPVAHFGDQHRFIRPGHYSLWTRGRASGYVAPEERRLASEEPLDISAVKGLYSTSTLCFTKYKGEAK